MLLSAWEAALARPDPLKGIALLAVQGRGVSEASPAALSLGELARRLLELQVQWFEPWLHCVCECPTCAELVEADCDARSLREAAPTVDISEQPLRVVKDRYSVVFRLPTAFDLTQVADAENVATARTRILERCVIEARLGEVSCAPRELPHDVTIAIADAIENADPLADIGLALQCPACQAAWTAMLDPSRFLLASVDQAARRIMEEVHCLARAYGWSEAETLSLSHARRRAYIALAGA